MNYYEWSLEYRDSANKMAEIIDKLKKQRKAEDMINKKDIDIKIAQYRIFYNECLSIANHLYLRSEGIE